MSLTRKHRNSHKQNKHTRKKTKTSGYQIQLYSPNKAIAPGDDFYKYVNSTWLKHSQIPSTKSVFGVSEEIEKRIEQQTDALMNDCIQQSKRPPATAYLEKMQQMIGTLAQSVLTTNDQKNNIHTVQNVLASIQSLTSKEEVAVVMGEFMRYKIHGLFTIYGQYENKNKTEFTYTISTGTLGLPDPSYYYRKSLHRKEVLVQYKHMLTRLGKLFGIPRLECVISVEKIIAGVLLRVDRDTIEHERRGEDLEKDFPYIPFDILFETMGLTHWRTRIFYVESLRWLHTLNKLYHHLGLDYWRLLLSLQFILFSLTWLPPPYSTLSFKLYHKALRGQQKPLPREKQAIYVVQRYSTSFFSRLYVEKIMDRSVKPHAIEMLQDLLHFAEKRLDAISWLEPKTREKAQEKVKRMRYIVAYPDHFEQHRIPKLNKDNSIYNLLQLGEWQTELEISKLGQRINQRKEWDDAVFVVNAYYYGQANEIVIPSGILQMPFFDQSRSIAWNYGGLGCVLCHEICHAFDKEGKEYDPDGFQKRWWTRSDNLNYNKQTKEIIELYGKQRVAGFPVSGKKTLSENIADIGGMGIALDALHHKLDEMKLTGEERNQAFRDFFTSFAVSWRYKDKTKKRIQALIMDRHSPPFLRVNLVVSQFQEWYDAFDVKPGDKLYLAPEKRIRIF
jgi:putative endopeptidase